jgi:hypothetical protein
MQDHGWSSGVLGNGFGYGMGETLLLFEWEKLCAEGEVKYPILYGRPDPFGDVSVAKQKREWKREWKRRQLAHMTG